MGVVTAMRRIAILVALAACEPDESGTSETTGVTSADDGTEETGTSESSSGGGEESTGEPLPDCLLPDGDLCPADGMCWQSDKGTVCVEPCSDTGQCRAGLECRSAPPGDPLPGEHCVLVCPCGDELACAPALGAGLGVCVWPD